MFWTEELVREKLPTVSVEVYKGDTYHDCRVIGRQNKFATVVTNNGLNLGEWSWASIAHSLNNNTLLQG
jgi:hypothetical protein